LTWGRQPPSTARSATGYRHRLWPSNH
jgi:hypothetical protein